MNVSYSTFCFAQMLRLLAYAAAASGDRPWHFGMCMAAKQKCANNANSHKSAALTLMSVCVKVRQAGTLKV